MSVGSVPQIMRCIMVTHPSSEVFSKQGQTDWWLEDISDYVPKNVRAVFISGSRVSGAGQLQARMWEDPDSWIMLSATGSHSNIVTYHVAYNPITGVPYRRIALKQTVEADVFQLKIYGYYVDGIKGGSTIA